MHLLYLQGSKNCVMSGFAKRALKLLACLVLMVFVVLWFSHSSEMSISGRLFHSSKLPESDRSGFRTLGLKPAAVIYKWSVNKSSRSPDEVKHIAFIKVHKAARTTMFNIFVRFSLSRDLNAMFPDVDNLLSEKIPKLHSLIDHPSSPPFLFDILCNHVIFRKSQIAPWFPNDTQYMTILRRPRHQVQSAFNYYKTVWNETYLRKAKNFSDFLKNKVRFEPANPFISFTNNRMSLDLGLPPEQIQNKSYVSTFIQTLRNTFDLVLIVERFDESLLLLKRRLRWTMKDILYVPLHVFGKHQDSTLVKDPKLIEKFDQFGFFDKGIYDYFVKEFEREVTRQGPDFIDELSLFTRIKDQVCDFCNKKSSRKALTLPETKWNKKFAVEFDECSTLKAEELILLSFARDKQLARMKDNH